IDSTLGPILGERATTAGKGTFNIAVAYNVADFQRVDGREEIEVTLRHCTEFACTGGNPDLPLFKDVIQVDVRMRLKSQTLTTFLVYGLRNNLDIGLLLPFVRNDLTIFSHARVITAPGSVPGVHVFDPLTESPGQFGTAHAMGIGDMILRAKYGLTRLPFDAAILADVTVPTGNKANFLGTGAFRARGVFIASATGERFSPHLNLGMEVNAENENLSSIEYRLGSEWAISPRVTLVGDLLGTVRPFLGDEFEARAVETQSLVGRSEIDFALGAKYKIRDNAVLLFNYLVPMNDAGIRPETSFTFGVQMAVK
ncbi:MAG: transporter, partial [Thermoanaerobaculia bacterium]